MSAAFEIIGGSQLKGEIIPQGAKNEALQVICACLLTEEPVEIRNVPDISDVVVLVDILRAMGVDVQRIDQESYRFHAKEVNIDYMLSDEYRREGSKIRGAVMLLGPLLARFKLAYLAKPGGDKIGRRRLDTHLNGLVKLGASFDHVDNDSLMKLSVPLGLQGCYILMEEASVTGTANLVMAAVLAKGETTIFNAACEPYVMQLCKMLVKMGAKIYGIGSNMLQIQGVKELGGTEHVLLPDMIEVGSFIGLAAMTRSDLLIKNVQLSDLGLIPLVFKNLGITTVQQGDDIYVPQHLHYMVETFHDGSIMNIADAPWPGFTPDLISIALVVATQACGSVLIHQKMFESRLFFVDKLMDMGAQIILCDPHRAVVIGHNHNMRLRGLSMSSPDIRAGVALLIAALSAEGKSIIRNIEQIDRGYQRIDQRLRALGAQIERVSEG